MPEVVPIGAFASIMVYIVLKLKSGEEKGSFSRYFSISWCSTQLWLEQKNKIERASQKSHELKGVTVNRIFLFKSQVTVSIIIIFVKSEKSNYIQRNLNIDWICLLKILRQRCTYTVYIKHSHSPKKKSSWVEQESDDISYYYFSRAQYYPSMCPN